MTLRGKLQMNAEKRRSKLAANKRRMSLRLTALCRIAGARRAEPQKDATAFL